MLSVWTVTAVNTRINHALFSFLSVKHSGGGGRKLRERTMLKFGPSIAGYTYQLLDS